MALPTVTDCKNYLKIENTAEDTLVGQLLAEATAISQRRLGCLITKASRTMKDRAQTSVFYSNGPTSLIAPNTPFAPSSLVVTDADGAAVANADLEIDGVTGIIRYADGSPFENGPYTIVADVGLSAHPDYAAILEGTVSRALKDFVADLYQRRSPGAKSETAAGGVSRTWTEDGIPCRVAEVLDSIRSSL